MRINFRTLNIHNGAMISPYLVNRSIASSPYRRARLASYLSSKMNTEIPTILSMQECYSSSVVYQICTTSPKCTVTTGVSLDNGPKHRPNPSRAAFFAFFCLMYLVFIKVYSVVFYAIGVPNVAIFRYLSSLISVVTSVWIIYRSPLQTMLLGGNTLGLACVHSSDTFSVCQEESGSKTFQCQGGDIFNRISPKGFMWVTYESRSVTKFKVAVINMHCNEFGSDDIRLKQLQEIYDKTDELASTGKYTIVFASGISSGGSGVKLNSQLMIDAIYTGDEDEQYPAQLNRINPWRRLWNRRCSRAEYRDLPYSVSYACAKEITSKNVHVDPVSHSFSEYACILCSFHIDYRYRLRNLDDAVADDKHEDDLSDAEFYINSLR